MAKKKPSYRKHKKRFDLTFKIIIVLAVVLVITVVAVIVKNVVPEIFKPDVKYPDTTKEVEMTEPVTDDIQNNNGEPAVKYVTVELDRQSVNNDLVLSNEDNVFDIKNKEDLLSLADMPHENFYLADGDIKLQKQAYEAFYKLTNDFASGNGDCPLKITKAYSTDAEDSYDHRTGLGFDVKLQRKNGDEESYGRNVEEVRFISEQMKYYGFILRYPVSKAKITKTEGDYDHFRYVGVPHSVYMTENNLCLEEYTSRIKTTTFDAPLQINVSEKETYNVFYAEAGTSIKIAENSLCSVSACGDGYIVAVKK